jgi:hypothetical protein
MTILKKVKGQNYDFRTDMYTTSQMWKKIKGKGKIGKNKDNCMKMNRRKNIYLT